jgi:hypothetical protein
LEIFWKCPWLKTSLQALEVAINGGRPYNEGMVCCFGGRRSAGMVRLIQDMTRRTLKITLFSFPGGICL